MPYFLWKGTDVDGKELYGKLFARDRDKLAILLLQEKIILTDAEKDVLQHATVRISKRNLKEISESMACLLESGVRIDDALELVKNTFNFGVIKFILDDLLTGLKEGVSLKSLLEAHGDYFDPLFCTVIASAQASGNLEEAFKTLARHYKKQEEILYKLKSSLFMPIVTLITFFLIAFSIFLFIVPQFEVFFKMLNLNNNIPVPAQILFRVSNFLRSRNFIYLVLIFKAIFIFLFFLTSFSSAKNSFVRKFKEKFILRIPVLGRFIYLYSLSIFLRALHLSLSGGLHLVEALSLAIGTLKNGFIKSLLKNALSEVISGKPLSKALEDRKNLKFKKELIFFVQMGEKTGNLSQMISRAAGIYETDTYQLLSLISRLLPIFLLFLLSGLISLLIISIYLPILTFSKFI